MFCWYAGTYGECVEVMGIYNFVFGCQTHLITSFFECWDYCRIPDSVIGYEPWLAGNDAKSDKSKYFKFIFIAF